MNTITWLIAALILLIIASAFFSGSETAMMSLNRYRLRHLVKKQNRAAKRISKLLENPDRLLSVILIGNTFANIFASAIATVIAVKFFGNAGVVVTTIVLTIIILIFAEIIPKTVAALHPERTAFPVSFILFVLLKIIYPLVWLATLIARGFLRMIGIKIKSKVLEPFSHEEMRTVVHEASGKMSAAYKNMLLGILDLGGITVDDIKVPRSEIIGINLQDSWEKILEQLTSLQHTRLPVYQETIDHVHGILHLRRALNLMANGQLNKKSMLEIMEEVYFIPESTPLNVQLVNFRQEKCRIGLIVDEYGDIKGLVTLEDILEEIVGEFTTNLTELYKHVRKQKDGSYLIDGSVNIREINRALDWALPVRGPKTLNGLLLEYLETIPDAAIGLILAGHRMEVLEIEGNGIKIIRVWPKSSSLPLTP